MTSNDTTGQVDIPGMGDGPAHELRVGEIIHETADSCSIVFEIPRELEERFRYKAGQFLTLQVPYEGKTLSRCYSLASSPDTESVHKVTIKRVEDGRISNWVNEHLRAGDVVRVLPPGGLFVLNHDENPLVMFAGGSGITPIISILKTALATTTRAVKLVYANRDDASIIFRAELDRLAADHADRLEIVHCLDAVDGFLTANRVAELIAGHGDSEYYICGPAIFMDIVEEAVGSAGVSATRIHIERFVSPPDPDERADSATATAAAVSGETPNSITVYLDGKTQEVPYESGQTVLRAAQKAGLEPPFSCTDGFCGCCMAKVASGAVEMIHNDFLSKKELSQGWVLTCQSVPSAGPLKIEYPD
jgi:3-ketosteroid 9alpha-monooxygenase subunit B